ncbi:MAG: DNA polymerase I [Lachnospiraceae bacterium]|nr:DNA polymerase I [Lachnospiraceae bacterium]
MSEKIVLIDGHSMLNRAFYGVPDLTNSEGIHTNAVYGFLNIMFHLLDEEKPQYLAVAFDLSAPTFRHKTYAEYKGTRKPMLPELKQQVPLIKEVLTAMQIPLMMLEGYEADDLIGTVSKQASEQGLEVTIISGDRDLLQLADERVLVRIPKTLKGSTTVENYHTQEVIDKYGVTPPQIIELKALMGDASDNIPGIPGVGEKTAAKIIAQFGSIENAYAHVDEIQPKRAQNSLRENYDKAQLSKYLATIEREAPFTLDIPAATVGNIYTAQARDLCRRLELRTLIRRFEKELEEGGSEKEPEQLFELSVAETSEQAAEVCASLEEALAGGQESVLGLAFPVDEQGAVLGAAAAVGGRALYLSLAATGSREQLGERIAVLAEKAKQVSLLDVKAALPALEQLGLQLPEECFFDAGVAAYLLNPLTGHYLAEDLAKDHLDQLIPGRGERLGKLSDQKALQEKKPEACAWFGTLAAVAAQAAGVLSEKLEDTGMMELFCQIEMPLVFTLHGMTKEGIAVRGEELRTYGENLTGRIRELETAIHEQAGESFNINSPKQLGTILFEKLELPYGKKTKTGYSTAADILEKLAQSHKIAADILEYRQLTKLKSTYADGLAAYIREDGRIHGNFNQTITATGRISSTEPNLQNIPVRSELGRQLRRVFVPREGYTFIDADYSQIELRVLAACSGDAQLIEAYQSAQDIHAITASQVFHIPLDQVTAQERRNAKAVNFGIVYGISSFGLSQGLSITRQEAQEYIEKYFETYPGVHQFLNDCVAQAKEKGYSVTMFGRRRPIPELSSSNFMQRSFGERVAMNAPIQGAAADIIKVAMIRTDRRLKAEGLSSRLILQVHDELLVETAPGESEAVMKILKEEMMGAADLPVALEIDAHEGDNWYEAK